MVQGSTFHAFVRACHPVMFSGFCVAGTLVSTGFHVKAKGRGVCCILPVRPVTPPDHYSDPNSNKASTTCEQVPVGEHHMRAGPCRRASHASRLVFGTSWEMTSEKKSALSLAVLDAKSPANQYLLNLLENKGSVTFQNPTSDRIQEVFEVLDQVLSQLGVFSPVLSLIRAELYDAVYSPPVTMCQDRQISDLSVRVPYFSLLGRLQTERNEEVERVTSELHTVTATLLQKAEEVRALRARCDDLQGQKRTLEAAISMLQLEVVNKCQENRRLQEEVKLQPQRLETEKQNHMETMTAVQAQLAVTQERVHRLEQNNASYQALQTAFQAPVVRKKHDASSPDGNVPADRTQHCFSYQAHIVSFLQTSAHLHEQLLQVQNRVMDDFDVFLEKQPRTADPASGRHPQEKETEMKKNFTGRMAEISAELVLLAQLRESLDHHNSQRTRPSEAVSARSQKPLRAAGSLERTESDAVHQFFSLAIHPDETLLNRYAAIIYTSADNGKIYNELPGASVCGSCGERTFLCPHKISATKVIQVPSGCTHVKICRPRAYKTDLAAKLAGDGPRVTAGAAAADRTRRCRAVLTGANLSNLENRFESRLKLRRETPRTISQELCLELAEDLVLAVLHQSGGALEVARVVSVQDLLWDLLLVRYMEVDISSLALQDLLVSVRAHSLHSKVLWMLGRVLLGEMDAAVLLYALLQAEVLRGFSLTHTTHFESFVALVYPFLQESERDCLALEFTAFSERVVSPGRVLAFILHLILQDREPFIMECEDTLSFYMKTVRGYLTGDELCKAMEKFAPLSTKTQNRCLIQQSLLSSQSSFIPIHSAAQIMAFLMAREIVRIKNKRNQIFSKRKENAENTRSEGSDSMGESADLRSLFHVINRARGKRRCENNKL